MIKNNPIIEMPQTPTLRVGRKPENMKFNSKGNILIKNRAFVMKSWP